jgi:hypothetical protein
MDGPSSSTPRREQSSANPRVTPKGLPTRPDPFGYAIHGVFPDGKRFLFVDNPVQPEVRELRVVINWFEELKRLVPAK